MDNTGITGEEARDRLRADAAKVTEEDLETVVRRADELTKTFEVQGPLSRFVNDVKILISLVQDYVKGDYRAVPWWAISSVVAALLYVLSPIDIIPDFIPFLGFLDDAMVIGGCLLLVEKQLVEYDRWKKDRALLK